MSRFPTPHCIILAAIAAPWCGFAVEAETETTAVSKKSPTRSIFWSRNLLPTQAYELGLTVLARDPFKAGSATAKPGGSETWAIPENLESHAKFVGSVPRGQDAKTYTPVFTGVFKEGSGKGNDSGGKDVPTWTVTGHYTVNAHVHESSWVDANGNPDAGDQVDSANQGIEHYPVNVTPEGNTTTELFAAAKVPGEGAAGLFRYTPFVPKRETPKKSEEAKNQKDPEHGDENAVRWTLYALFSYKHPHAIVMPQWPVPAPDPEDPTKQVVPPVSEAGGKEWNKFYGALLVHEQGHRTIFNEYLPKVDAVINAFNKQSYIGLACHGAGSSNTISAANRAMDLATILRTKETDKMVDAITDLRDAHEKAQADYEDVTNHGTTQSNLTPGAVNTVVTNDIPLAP